MFAFSVWSVVSCGLSGSGDCASFSLGGSTISGSFVFSSAEPPSSPVDCFWVSCFSVLSSDCPPVEGGVSAVPFPPPGVPSLLFCPPLPPISTSFPAAAPLPPFPLLLGIGSGSFTIGLMLKLIVMSCYFLRSLICSC
ncbi:hypothetical protein [Candidatus Mycoplasma haematohominis]|uniref:hypothetical protein n=1 Tax=Candidatus Mycoplasma haematohominis TaxID=1494318 RepID=UPI001C0A6BB4|nr:hypothetical protein [Candidatus Mycoplasma haemohominis]